MYVAPGPARKTTVFATSSTWAKHLIGICRKIPLPPSLSMSPATSSVGAKPGSTAFTRTPKRASSTALQRVNELIAPFEAA